MYTMQFFTYGRYGEQQVFDRLTDAEKVAKDLVRQLRTEQDEPPDDEHTSVSICRGDYSISINVSGLVSLLDQRWLKSKNPRKAMEQLKNFYMRDVPDEELIELVKSFAAGDMEKVNSAPWVSEDEVPPYVQDFYRTKRQSVR